MNGEPVSIVPGFATAYATLGPYAEALFRAVVGLALVPHGLRVAFGLLQGPGFPIRGLAGLAAAFDAKGYRPGRLWAPLTAIAELIGGPMLAIGLLTRPVALPIFVLLALSTWDHARNNGWFWNNQGMEYPLIWAVAVLYFLINGGGPISADALVLGRAF